MNRLIAYAVLAAVLAAAGWGWYSGQISDAEARGASAQREVDQKATDKIKADAAALLADETAKTAAIEKSLREFKTKQEIKDVEATKFTAKQNARIAGLVNANGQLRDPFATSGCGVRSSGAQAQAGASPSNSGNDSAQTQGLLSAEFSRFVRTKLAEADEINNAYASCRPDLMHRIELGQ